MLSLSLTKMRCFGCLPAAKNKDETTGGHAQKRQSKPIP
jgi:hypothetical protein